MILINLTPYVSVILYYTLMHIEVFVPKYNVSLNKCENKKHLQYILTKSGPDIFEWEVSCGKWAVVWEVGSGFTNHTYFKMLTHVNFH